MIKVGEYIRTPYGKIGKITNIPKHNKYFDDGFYIERTGTLRYTHEFIECGSEAMKQLKSTPNIIDLIEVGDYVNGYKVLDIAQAPEKALYLNDISQKCALIPVCDYQIKSIVTKEMFSQMEYKVGE